MIVPSIDIMDGQAVQLVGGKEKALEAGDPRPLAERFGRVGEVAVIDLDAAMGRGSNAELIEELLSIAPCRVGGGIRDVETARRWLDAGARKVILGTAARPEILRELPRDRVIAALDGVDGRVVIEGWQAETDELIEDRIDELKPYVGEFLITFVEIEGRMTGLPIDRARDLAQRCGDARLTVAGGVRNADDVREADRVGADAQVGMSLYTGAMDLADGFCAPLRSDRDDGLWPTVVCDNRGEMLGLVYSSLKSVREAIESGTGTYYSRSRSGLWKKGESSGNTQRVLGIDTDCDRDTLRFTVTQDGSGFCHLGTRTCFGEVRGLNALDQTLRERMVSAPEGSYTRRLFDDKALLDSKLREEAAELCEASTPAEAAWEAADVIYFALAVARRHGVGLVDIERELDRRALRVSRRGGEAKQ